MRGNGKSFPSCGKRFLETSKFSFLHRIAGPAILRGMNWPLEETADGHYFSLSELPSTCEHERTGGRVAVKLPAVRRVVDRATDGWFAGTGNPGRNERA